ncbi:hypothetical protein C8F04DRAFT_392071 [Mycena alexandri]|uniref:BTB domain-containing protein n=1 Tax=Mycena alexandri TaxID=1745969 RepID=A0AAD6S123_9AGAR|nr:hypothetical protein C8F04DRAFT_392071 [Mycena alexandri]
MSSSSITRSELFWYEDGSVVLQVQDTQFRVFWGILCHQSSFFRDMQSLPQPLDQPTVDGCPVVVLYDDLADVETLLKALYIPTFLAAPELPLPVIGALIRLGRKYDFHDLLHSALARLIFENPTTLEEHDALLIGKTAYKPTRIVTYRGLLMDIITLARENNILTVLPCAYYRAVTHYSPKELFDGFEKTSVSLAPAEQRQCILGRDSLIKGRFEPRYTLGWLKKWDFTDCSSPTKCSQARSARLHFYMECNPLWILHRYKSQEKNLFCSECERHTNDLTTSGRKKLWEDLPGFFELPPWNELNNDL